MRKNRKHRTPTSDSFPFVILNTIAKRSRIPPKKGRNQSTLSPLNPLWNNCLAITCSFVIPETGKWMIS